MRTNASPSTSTSRRSLFPKTLNQNSKIKQRTLGVKSLSSKYLSTRGRQRKIPTQRKIRRNYVDHRRCKRDAGEHCAHQGTVKKSNSMEEVSEYSEGSEVSEYIANHKEAEPQFR